MAPTSKPAANVVVDRPAAAVAGRAAVVDAAAATSRVDGAAIIVAAVGVVEAAAAAIVDASGPGTATVDAAATDMDAAAMGECVSTRLVWISA